MIEHLLDNYTIGNSAGKGMRKCCKAKQLRSKVFVLFRIFTFHVQFNAYTKLSHLDL